MNKLTPDEHRILVDAIQDSATVVYKGRKDMNERIRELAEQVVGPSRLFGGEFALMGDSQVEKFAQLIVAECDRLNKKNSFELLGVIVDTEEGAGFDSVCLDTVKRVEQYLFNNSLKDHFGVKE